MTLMIFEGDVTCVWQELPCKIKGFTVETDDGRYVITLNSRLSREQNLETYRHEIDHIKNNDFASSASASGLEFTRHYTREQ